MKKESILLIWDRIGDYHYARVKACEKILQGEVFTADLAGTDALYKWKSIEHTKHTILSIKSAEEPDFMNRFFAFRKIIKSHSITTVAMPYGRSEYHVFLLYARLKGIRTIVFSESWYSRGLVKDFLKSILLKTLGSKFFVSGQRAHHHFTTNYNIHSDKIKIGYSVVDNEHFIQASNNTSPSDKKYVICVARYSEEKNLEFLIRCFATSVLSEKYTLLIIGDGPQRSVLNQLIESLALTDKVKLTGWVSYKELPALYASSACFILPSTFEPWGLVVNEAMAASLPILLSSACGCCPELLEVDRNGFVFDPLNSLECIAVFNRFAELSDEDIHQFGTHSKKLIDQLSPQTWARVIEEITHDTVQI